MPEPAHLPPTVHMILIYEQDFSYEHLCNKLLRYLKFLLTVNL